MQDIYKFSKKNQEMIKTIINNATNGNGNIEFSNYYSVSTKYIHRFKNYQINISIDHRNREMRISLKKSTDTLFFFIIFSDKINNYYISDKYFPDNSLKRKNIENQIENIIESSHFNVWKELDLFEKCIIFLNEIIKLYEEKVILKSGV